MQGLEGAVLRGAAHTLKRDLPFVYYEDTMLPTADRYGALLYRLAGENAYRCRCRNDCFCAPKLGQHVRAKS